MPDDTAAPQDGQTFRLIYRSRDLIPVEERKVSLGKLFSEARSNNKSKNVCGALLVSDDWFVQVLEGDEAVVRALYDHIATDPRHDTVTLLEAHAVEERVFARWAMAKMAGGDEPDIPLIAHRDGISPAAGRRTTTEQDLVLDYLREAALADVPSSS